MKGPAPIPVRPIQDDETELVARLQAGDETAFEALVRAHGGRMLSVARRMLGSEEEARDAVQDALLSAFRSLARFERKASLATWLHRIVVNAALMKLRNRRRKPEAAVEDLLPKFLEDGHRVVPSNEWSPSAETALERSEVRTLVRSQIDRLPEAYRSVLLLRDIEELDTQETADLLGLTPNAVKIRLHRARQALRTLLDPHFRTENDKGLGKPRGSSGVGGRWVRA